MNRVDGYASLNDYATLADGRAVALVAADGAIDWFAAPRLDAAPICAALLDPDCGGSITLEPAVPYESAQRYVDDSLVLRTTFRCEGGVVTVTDALNQGFTGPLPWTELARQVEGVSGEVPMRWRLRPGHRLGTTRPWARWSGDVPRIEAGDVQLAVVTGGLGTPRLDGGLAGVAGEHVVRERERGLLGVVATSEEPLWVPRVADIGARVERTIDGWRCWCADIQYRGPHAEAVRRSALLLKGLTFVPSRAIAAAATTSLPERVGGGRNFDYRFGWVRDASFALDAMGRIGLTQDVHASLSWLIAAVSRTVPEVRALYTLDGEPAQAGESHVHSLPGYRGSRPVRNGNGAADQLQLGAYGDLLDAVWQYVQHGGQLDPASADTLTQVADRVCDIWRVEDSGIWELGDLAHYTISKMGCWMALDRAVRLAAAEGLDRDRAPRWCAERDAVRAWTDEHCWSRTKHSYTFHADTDGLDAAVLLGARTGYLAADDPRLASTIDAVRTELDAGGPLLYRYSGMAEHEGAFLPCTFWLIEALATAGRQREAAREMERALTYAGRCGVYSEEVDPGTGELLGNLPQGLTHLAVISAVTTLWGAR